MANLWLLIKPKNIQIGSEMKEIWSKHCFNYIVFVSELIWMFLSSFESDNLLQVEPMTHPTVVSMEIVLSLGRENCEGFDVDEDTDEM